MEEHNKAPPKRIAQHKLAQEVLKLVHGKKLAHEAEQEHSRIFSKSFAPNPRTDHIGKQSTENVDQAVPIGKLDNSPTHSLVLPKSLIYNQPMSRILYHAGLVPSYSEGHRMVAKKGAYLGAKPSGSGTMGEQVDFSPAADWHGNETERYIIGDDTLIIRVGKWKVKIIKIISDEEFEEKGLSAPGWKECKPEIPIADDLKKMKTWNKKSYIRNARMHQNRP